MGISSAIEPSNERFFVAFPNPTKDELRIDFLNGYIPTTKALMQLIDINGKAVENWSGKLIQHRMTIEIKGLSAGTYLLSFNDAGKTDTRKIVVDP